MSDTPESPTPPPAPRAGAFQRVGRDVAAGARASAPVIKRIGIAIGDWLATVSWGKFFLVALLVLAFGGIMNSALFERAPAVVIERGDPADKVNVVVSVGPHGVVVAPGNKAPKPPAPPNPPGATRPPPSVSVDEQGVRISADKDGRKATVIIDAKGIRVEESKPGDPPASPAPPAPSVEADGTVVIPPEVAADPDKMAEAIESARDRIEEIVAEQVRQQVARRTRRYQEQSSDWFMSLVVLAVLAGVIIKVVLGSKKKAEVRAQAATATAAEEGLKRQLAEAQLKMMQAQVEPHFLFNTLASVDYLIETDPGRASKMQKNLIQYLRAALPQMREGSTTLGKEVSLCRAYLEILKVRMEDRLQFAITVPQGLSSARFPPMMLQSLVENAIKHGLEPKPEGGSLTLSADVVHGAVRVTVADTGLGFGASGTAGTGVGLANVRERLAALYGGSAKLDVEANSPSGTIATIEVPYVAEAESRTAAAAAMPG